jgi:hypothetical protein
MSEGTAAQVLAREAAWHLHHGDCLALLRSLPENSVDAMVTDPPSGIAFMSRAWDKDKGGRDKWIAWLAEIMREAFRVMKPGAHAFVWALPRTSGWTQIALEDAGFEVRDSVQHLFGSGFGKSKSARRALAMLRCELPGRHFESTLPKPGAREANDHVCADHFGETERDGWGTGLAPSHEVWWLARKPLEGTLAENLTKYGTGAINIDSSRVAHAGAADLADHQAQVAAIKARGGSMDQSWKNTSDLSSASEVSADGRWPKNTVLSHSPGCVRKGAIEVDANPTWDTPNRETEPSAFTGAAVSPVRHANGRNGEASAERRYDDKGSTSFAPLPGARRTDTETVEQWECVEGCPVRELALQSGQDIGRNGGRAGLHALFDGAGQDASTPTYRDTGTAARYYRQFHTDELDDFSCFAYLAKPHRSEKDAGCDHFRARSGAEATQSEEGQARLNSPRSGAGRKGGARNVHPTPKGIELVRYFTKMITPPGGVVLDLFAGSGTGGVAAIIDGFRWIGAELNDTDEEPFVSIARARLHHVEGRSFIPRESLRATEPPKQQSLFLATADGSR